MDYSITTGTFNQNIPTELADNEIWVDLRESSIYGNFNMFNEEKFPGVIESFVKSVQVVVSNTSMPFTETHKIESSSIHTLRIALCPGSDATLLIDCPNLFALNVENCGKLIMSDSTRPKRLELVNVGAKDSVVNIPIVNPGKEWRLFGKCDNIGDNERDFFDSHRLESRELDMKIKERFIWI